MSDQLTFPVIVKNFTGGSIFLNESALTLVDGSGRLDVPLEKIARMEIHRRWRLNTVATLLLRPAFGLFFMRKKYMLDIYHDGPILNPFTLVIENPPFPVTRSIVSYVVVHSPNFQRTPQIEQFLTNGSYLELPHDEYQEKLVPPWMRMVIYSLYALMGLAFALLIVGHFFASSRSNVLPQTQQSVPLATP